jgi:hypothetical protein
MEVSGQLHALTALSLGKSPQYSLNRSLGEPQSCSGCNVEEIYLVIVGNSILAVQLVAIAVLT